jgi:hypothetical protein
VRLHFIYLFTNYKLPGTSRTEVAKEQASK